MKRYCFALDLQDDPKMIAEYEAWHTKIIPEIRESITSSGIVVMDIFRAGDRMFMIMETEDHFDLEEKAAKDAASPAVQAWKNSCGNTKSHFPLQSLAKNGL